MGDGQSLIDIRRNVLLLLVVIMPMKWRFYLWRLYDVRSIIFMILLFIRVRRIVVLHVRRL